MQLLKLFLVVLVVSLLACSLQESNLFVDKNSEFESPKVTFSEPGVLKLYSAFYVSPITIYGNDQGRLVPASNVEMDKLEHKFKSKIIAALGSHHTQFNQPA
ncbi:MAG: hypothetical protein WD512_06190 [Candidatus Paceibacterota bacterium]